MRTTLLLLMLSGFIGLAHAEQMDDSTNRDPAAAGNSLSSAAKRLYPGAVDEEDLAVQNRLPEATLKTDSRSLQKGVYKTLYNQELKDEGREAVEE